MWGATTTHEYLPDDTCVGYRVKFTVALLTARSQKRTLCTWVPV